MHSLSSLLTVALVALSVAANPVDLEERGTCKVKSGVSGTCISTSSCHSQNKFSEAGHCPGATNIQCCYTPTCKVNSGVGGSCLTTSACNTKKWKHEAGHCPGGTNIQCCYNPATKPPPTSSCGAKVVAAAESQKGVPYVFGGGSCTGKTSGGFDCSGLVRYSVYKAKGVCLVHSAQQQYLDTKHGKRIPLAQRQAGDVVFWTTGSNCNSGVDHTAVVKNANTLVVARHTGTLVQEQAYWTKSGDMKICPYAMRYC
jgi:hypothetical protein